ncbi:peroxidase-related enzyme [Pseudomonadota bacterium]
MAWIQELEEKEASGELKEVYNGLIKKRGRLSNIMKIHSLRPDVMQKHMDLYISICFKKSGVSREDRELLAVVVSLMNDCSYCVHHHAEALKFFWKDEQRVENFIKDPQSVTLSDKQQMLVEYAMKLTNTPSKMIKSDVEGLRNCGYSDKDILDIALCISYFNFVNRIVLGLGVEFSEEEMEGYKY